MAWSIMMLNKCLTDNMGWRSNHAGQGSADRNLLDEVTVQ